MNSVFDERLLEKLVCPLTRMPLRFDQDRQELVSDAGLAYPIRNGVPVLLIEEALQRDREGQRERDREGDQERGVN